MFYKVNIILKGYLGNQLFIYTAHKKICKFIGKEKSEVVFYQFKKNIPSNNFKYLNIDKLINKKKSIILPRLLEELFFFFKFRLRSKIFKDTCNIKNLNNYKSITIDGYFQKKKWYENYWLQTAKDFFYLNFTKQQLKKVKSYPIVISLSWDLENAKLNRQINFEYYLKALHALKINYEENIIIIGLYKKNKKQFISFLKKNNFKKINFIRNTQNNFKKSMNDFLIIAKSKKLIMSNSTFCWWAAVSRHILKLQSQNVIAPKKWVTNKQRFGNPGCPNLLKWKFINNSLF